MDMSGGGSGGGAVTGEELRDIETEQLGFQAASGEDKLQLLPESWPSDNLPPATSSLLSIAPKAGLVAAAGPSNLIVATTESIRNTFIHEAAEGEFKIKKFTPQASLSIPRVSQVAFASDESCLVISAEQGGGLAVYDTNALSSGNAAPAFELSTEGESVRQILPNPNPAQEFSGFFGIVTTNGKLLLADLKERKLVTASSGSTVFAENVSCACWSRLGKQIIAGLADGTASQIDRQGVVKARIPEPPQLAQLKDPSSTATPITSIFWLETDDFLIIHTPVNPPDAAASDDSIYHFAHRNKQSQSWTFSKFPTDPCFPIVERKPASHFIQRLRDWENLSELLLLSSSASSDIGLFARSKVPLNKADPVVDAFTEARVQDQRRATMPLSVSGSLADTSPIGMVLDMGAKERIDRPIPNEESLDVSPIPLPALYTLNFEGMLSMWWVVYNEAVRNSKPYPDLIAADGPRPLGDQKPQQQSQSAAPTSRPTSSSASTFGSALGSGSGTPAQPSAFGQPSFGAPSTPAFGGTAALSNRQSAWGAPGSVATGSSTFGKPAFGQASTVGASSFGQASGMGAGRGSVWGQPSQAPQQQATPTANTGSVFGGNASQQSPFMSVGGKAAPSPFAAFGKASKENAASPFASPFASTPKPSLSAEPSGSTVSFGNNTSFGSGSTNFGVQSQPSYFGSPTPSAASGAFGKPSAPASREESMGDDNGTSTSASTSTAKPPGASDNKSPFGLGDGGFKLGSTFKGDGTAKDDLPKPANPGAGLFGANFGDALGGDTSKASSASEGAAWLSGRSTPAIKKEPDTENVPKLSDIPAAQAQPKAEEEKAASPPVNDAPLPPDPTTWKPKPGALPPPVPPGFGDDVTTPKKEEVEEEVTPPSKQNDKEADEALAGSPPVDLGQEKFSEGVRSDGEAEGPDDDDGELFSDEDEEDEREDEDEDEEGDEEDDNEDEDEQSTPKIEDQTGLSAFQARITPASPKRGDAQQQTESTTPATDKKESYTPAGMPKAPIMFAPPQRKGPESPRSPSPQRSATSPLRPMPNFATQQQAPRLPQQPATSRTPSSTQVFGASQDRKTSQTQPQPPQRIAVPPAQLTQSQQRSAPPSKPEAPDTGSLEDEEDARIQAILQAPIEPTADVPAFLAHQDYVANGTEKAGIGGQIEKVFRDINSMVDTVALNARSLQGFVEGNNQQQSAHDKSRLDLEQDHDWLLGEARQLDGVVQGIETQLHDGRLTDVRGALANVQEDENELTKLRAKSAEARKHIMARRDPDQLAQQYAAPLPMETQTLQMELRRETQNVQKLLAKAEEQLTVLRAELASLPSAQGADGRNGSGMPTVEAVEKTIRRMTQMIEQKSGDINVLESQIRKLGGPAALAPASNYEDDLVAGMKASRISRGSPAAMRSSQLRTSAYGSPTMSRRGRSSRSGTPGTPGARRSLFDVGGEEVEAYRAKREGRRVVLEELRDRVQQKGVRVVRVGE